MKMTPNRLKWMLNLYPPYLGAGVKVSHVSDDWKELRVSMPLRWYNKNAIGTHFGGSLYSMIDPHLVLLMMQLLGKDYLVWDKAAEIDFIKPGKSRVYAIITISDEILEEIKHQTADGEKYFPTFLVEVKSAEGELVAKVKKTLYARKKQQKTS